MIQAIGSALTGLSAAQQRMDALADDTANVNTTGFKASGHESVQGGLIETGRPLDLAIEGDGAFHRAGARPTRGGACGPAAAARIATASGQPPGPPAPRPPRPAAPAVAAA